MAAPNLFGVIDGIITKDVEWSPEVEKVYSPFIVNRALSQRKDTLFYAEAMNRRRDLSKLDQFTFYRYGMPKLTKKWAQWGKREKASELVELVSRVYGMSLKKAAVAVKLLTKSQAEYLVRAYTQHGGVSRTTKTTKDTS